jgi:hypothetical protein
MIAYFQHFENTIGKSSLRAVWQTKGVSLKIILIFIVTKPFENNLALELGVPGLALGTFVSVWGRSNCWEVLRG